MREGQSRETISRSYHVFTERCRFALFYSPTVHQSEKHWNNRTNIAGCFPSAFPWQCLLTPSVISYCRPLSNKSLSLVKSILTLLPSSWIVFFLRTRAKHYGEIPGAVSKITPQILERRLNNTQLGSTALIIRCHQRCSRG